MTNPFDPTPRRPYTPRRRAKESFFETKARVLSVLPIPHSKDFEVILVGGSGSRLSFTVEALAATKWLDKRDSMVDIEIGARQWLRKEAKR